MNIIKLTIVALATLILTSCGGSEEAKSNRLSTDSSTAKSEVKKEVEKKVTASVDFDETVPTLGNKGIGPVKSVTLADAIDDKMVAEGKELFKVNCTACHKFKKRHVGPALKDVISRRSPEWIMNMMLNSDEMLKKDPVAMGLLAKYSAPMAQQKISQEEARTIVEYLRTK